MKKILLLMSNVDIGGIQKSLIALLQYIDYTKYDVDLLLFDQTGILRDKIPSQVNVISVDIPKEFFYRAPQAIGALLKMRKIRLMLLRLVAACFSVFDKGLSAYILSKGIPKLDEEYDVAVDYAGQYLLYYMVNCVVAKRKITYFHFDYKKWKYYEKMDRKYYKYADAIVTVSDECVMSIREVFPEYKEKVFCVENIITKEAINIFDKGGEESAFEKDMFNIVTTGRMGAVKGFDFAVEALELLLKAGYNVRWYFVGPIVERNFVEDILRKHKDIGDSIVMVGATDNPYVYVKNADVYVQPSRFEGKSIAVEEAKVLHKPIVLTNYPTASDQIENKETGLIVEMNGQSIFEGIQKFLTDVQLCEHVLFNLERKCNGNEKEINKFYALIEDAGN